MQPFRLRWVGAAVMAALAAAVSGCGPGGSAFPRRDWHTLYLNLSQNPTTLDPAQVKDVAGGQIVAHIYGTLVAYDAAGKLTGDVAESYRIYPDGKTYEFRIRKGLTFANGRAVTSRDVVDSFLRTLSPATHSPRTWVLSRIKGAREYMNGETGAIAGLLPLSDDDLTIELEEPFAPFLGLLTMPGAAIVPREVDNFNERGFGSGPFRVAEFRPSERLTLERNPHYAGPGPEVNRIVYKIIEPPVARITEFRQGLIDIMEVPGDYYESLTGDAKTRDLVTRTDSFNVYFLGINCTGERFRDPRARRALACALDAQAMVRWIYPGRAEPAKGPIPPGIPGYVPDVKGVPFDLAKAKELLASAKFDREKPVRFLCGSDKDTVKTCQALRGELQKAGLAVELDARETGTFKQMLKNGDFDVFYYSWWADYPDAENFLAPLFMTSGERGGGNPTGYSSAEVDKLIREAQAEEEPAKRAELYRKIQEIVIEECPRVWLWHRKELSLRQPWVRGYAPSPIYNTDKGNLIRIVPPEK
jgi:peptide/nickel transport system substrate-binding protein/oligopeptide transport system substrate-binding protein